METENFHNQQNCGEISPGKLRRSGMPNTIGVNISTMRHNKNGGHICVTGEDDLVNIFALSFIWKDKISLPHRRRYKYDSVQ